MVIDMAKYNKTFELTPDDMELIEVALRKNVASEAADCADQPDAQALTQRVNELLGRLHSQKTFFRPSTGTYVSG